MAEAVRQRLKATWALAVCGNAGPDSEGGAPVGAVFIALAGPGGTAVREVTLAGDRGEIQLRSAAMALDLLRRAMTAAR
jgi:nicotinamide mononucleotide (NMN) deamidase PncC